MKYNMRRDVIWHDAESEPVDVLAIGAVVTDTTSVVVCVVVVHPSDAEAGCVATYEADADYIIAALAAYAETHTPPWGEAVEDARRRNTEGWVE